VCKVPFCKSHYSIGEAAAHVEDIVAQAATLEMPYVLLADTDSVSGIPEFLACIEKKNKKSTHPIKPLIGAHLSLASGGRCVVIAKNAAGWHELISLVSKINSEGQALESIPQSNNLVIPISNFSRAINHHPMLTSMTVHLQAKASAGFHFNSLNFKARSFLKNRIGTPWSDNRSMQLEGIMTILLELGDDFLHLLRSIRMRYQQRIHCINNHEVIDTHGCHQAMF
jgi:hypothetical protein